MTAILFLTAWALLIPGVVNAKFFGFSFASCGWRYAGQCKASCNRGEYILGTVPCAFGFLGTCCAPTLACSAYGGTCRDGGCFQASETDFTYKVHCPSVAQTCCLRRAIQVNVVSTPAPPVPSVPQRCAARRSFSRITSRILGGVAVNNQCQWPWMVSIRLGSPVRPGPHVCAGVLISNNKVLTTVGCVLGNNVFVTLEENDITRQGEVGEIHIDVSSEYSIHEGFVKNTARRSIHANDIAILTLDSPVPSRSCADPVCLPLAGERATDFNNCFIAGWGVNEAGDGLLHEANVRVLNNSLCSQAIAAAVGLQLPADKLCSSYVLDRTDVCPGDNGGMLVCEDASNTWSLFGIISDNACSRNLPIIYTDVQSHMDWISRHL